MAINASDFRAKINGEFVKNETQFILGTDSVIIKLFGNYNDFCKWKLRTKEYHKIQITSTDFEQAMILKIVSFTGRPGEAIEIHLNYWFSQREIEYQKFLANDK
jgi:hypothetical protein